MEHENDDLDILTQEEEADLDTANDSEDNSELEARLKKAEELANNYKIRAEKAEKLAKQKPSETSKQVTPELDNATLARIYGIEEEDFEEVLDMAKFKKLSIAETLKLGATKAILAEKAEFRKTAEVSNTGNARRGASKVSDDVLLKNLADGKIPDAGSDEAERLFWARRGGKR
tara:strand:+ start:4880 stop:5401 length:522 start_codon:yes stop_codon:yes gene_type:complete